MTPDTEAGNPGTDTSTAGDTARAAAEAVALMDFDLEAMGPGDVALNWAPRPPEMVQACWIDAAGAAHYYTYECVGTVPAENHGGDPDKLYRVFVTDNPNAPPAVDEAIRERGAVVAGKREYRDLEGLTEDPYHSFRAGAHPTRG